MVLGPCLVGYNTKRLGRAMRRMSLQASHNAILKRGGKGGSRRAQIRRPALQRRTLSGHSRIVILRGNRTQ